jgi:Cu(I)/Ag(I) efflux system membrane fusion protein
LIGVRTGRVEKRDLIFLVRASGRVAYDPDLYNVITEYREAVRAREKTKNSAWPDVLERANALVRAAQLRLRQMGISENQMNTLMEGGDDSTNLLLGQKGGKVWVYAQIYEYESGLVQPGQMMEVTASSLAGRRLSGRVIAVDPILNAESRTLKVRAEISNPRGDLKPEMYVEATIRVDLGRRLAIPEEAILDTGTRQLVFVHKKPGTYEPREVDLGQEAEDYREVIAGVKEGERVVTSANFLIDSESKLKAALSEVAGDATPGH